MSNADNIQFDLSTLPSLPIGWAWSVPSEFCSVVASGSTPTSDKMFEGQGEVPFIKVYNLTHHGKLDFSVRPTFIGRDTHALQLKRSIARPGDVLINIVGPPLGKVSLVPNDFPEWNINQAIVLFRPCEGVFNRYLSFAFLTDSIMKRVTRLSKATAGQSNIGVSMCRHLLPVPLAPLNEQRRIVGRIEELFSDLEAGVAALTRARANLKRYRASVLKAAVEGALTAEWRTQHPQIESASKLLERILTERRRQWEADQLAKFATAGKQPPNNWQAKYVEPAPPDTTNLPTLPDGWSVASLEQLTSAARPICYGILMPKENIADGVLYVKVKDMKGDRIDLSGLHRTRHDIAAAFARASLKFGDLLLAIRGTYGRVAEVPVELEGGNITQDTARLAVATEMNSAFVATALRASPCQTFFKRVARGVAVKGVNIGDVRQCPIPMPPPNEQAEIVATVSEKLSQIESAEVAIDHSLRRAARLRQSILKQAFEGKLVPQDPTDEPAEVLLGRLRKDQSVTGGSSQARIRVPNTSRSKEP